MAEFVILVNGLPGSGKSTLSEQLGDELEVPIVSKDSVKEYLADLCEGQVSSRRLGQIASETMWQVAAAIPGTVSRCEGLGRVSAGYSSRLSDRLPR